MSNTDKPIKSTKSYDPKYEKARKQKPISFSLNDETQVRLLDFIKNFEYGTYFKTILAQLNMDEQKRIIDSDLLTIPSSLIKHNITQNNVKINAYFTAVDATRHFDHDDLAKHLSDDALLKELANRNLIAAELPTVSEDKNTDFTVVGANRLSSIAPTNKSTTPIINEFGCVEVIEADGTIKYIEAEHYAEYIAQSQAII